MEVERDCVVTDAYFAERVEVTVNASRLDLSGTRFDRGGRVEMDASEVRLERVSTGSLLHISGSATSQAKPAVLSIQNADVGTMSFAMVDMRRCLFYGANDLHNIRIEPTVALPTSPKSWRWSHRQCIADEFAWRGRAAGRHGRGWSLPGTTLELAGPGGRKPTTDLYLPPRDASQVVAAYRELRRSLEVKGNEPGAADFYYGEMEMRRRAPATSPERLILWLYWLVSGYSLRGWRALAWLIVVVFGLAGLLQAIGFDGGDPPFRDALIYAAQSTVSIVSSNEALTRHVSWAGEVLRIVLRIVGPVLLALALLSVRNRVKR
jgi:hypothetical protein